LIVFFVGGKDGRVVEIGTVCQKYLLVGIQTFIAGSSSRHREGTSIGTVFLVRTTIPKIDADRFIANAIIPIMVV